MTVFAVLDILIDPDNRSSAGSRSLGGLRTSMTSGSSFGPVPTECRTEFLRVRIVVIEAKDVLGEIGIGAEGERGVPDDLFLLGRNEVYFNCTLDAAPSWFSVGASFNPSKGAPEALCKWDCKAARDRDVAVGKE